MMTDHFFSLLRVGDFLYQNELSDNFPWLLYYNKSYSLHSMAVFGWAHKVIKAGKGRETTRRLGGSIKKLK